MTVLSRVGAGFPRRLAEAVLIAPRFLDSYVKYAAVATQDPHNDYAVHMKKVCKQSHGAFIQTVKRLAADDQRWFRQHVIDVDSYRPIALPEAE